jgi:hypothetical protein
VTLMRRVGALAKLRRWRESACADS